MTTTTLSSASLSLSRLADTVAATPIVARTLPVISRSFLAAIFLFSGVGKLAAPGPTIDYIAASGLPFPELGYAAAVAVEVGGGALLVAGYQTRLVAFLLAGFSLVTALAFHFNLGDQNQLIHFLKNIAMAGGLLQVAAAGGGAVSLDAKQGRS